MAKKGELTEKQRRFVENYILDPNASEAARKAGYSPKTAGSIGEENLRKPDIAAAINAARNKRGEQIEVDQIRVALELARLAFADGRQLVKWQEDGCRSDSEYLTDELAATIAGIEVETMEVPGKKDGPVILRKKVKVRTWNKNSALNSLGEHFGMFKGSGSEGSLEDLMRALAAVLLPRVVGAGRIEG